MKLIEMAGEKFGRWTVLSYAGERRWLCRCDCGFESLHRREALVKGRTFGCLSCHLKRDDQGSPAVDLSGQRFWKWTVTRHAGGSMWECRCDCGRKGQVKGEKLQAGYSRGCVTCQGKPSPSMRKVLPDRHYRVDWDSHI